MRAGRKPDLAENSVGGAHALEVAAREDDQRRAVRVVAGRSLDAEDCRELLGMLGLEKAAGLAVTTPPPPR